jgi:hypothetical protein
MNRWLQWQTTLLLIAHFSSGSAAAIDSPAVLLPIHSLLGNHTATAPINNAAYAPPASAAVGAPFASRIRINQGTLSLTPAILQSVIEGRDARLFPAITLTLATEGDVLIPAEAGLMVRETGSPRVFSYWRVIPQYGRVWHEARDGDWSRAAFPLMLVNDTENHAHQGLATFVYRKHEISDIRVQFVQQTGPYLLTPQFVAAGQLAAMAAPLSAADSTAVRHAGRQELASRLPAQPWQNLTASVPPRTLDGFGGPLRPEWQVATALVRDDTLYYQASATPFGPYPYPLEMRFGVRSMMKSVAAPLSLLHLAEVYGPWVLTLRIGDYVPNLDPKWQQIRFIDAANMASGFGGTGSFKTAPNDIYDGYLGGDYDAWYLAHSQTDKIAAIRATLHPYPWNPGTVVRYRDQDFYLLGAAVDAFLKSMRGSSADVWQMLQEEVFAPIGIVHAPAVHTREADDREGLVWFNAGYYPTLDDIAKIALLYQHHGAQGGKQLLHRQLTDDLLAARGARVKSGDASLQSAASAADTDRGDEQLYQLGFHYTPYVSRSTGIRHYLPTMSGSGENEAILFPNGLVSIRTAKASQVPTGMPIFDDTGPATIRAVERLSPF